MIARFTPTEEDLEERHKYGIYFDDDYDYMQHLRDVREVSYSIVAGTAIAYAHLI